MSSLADIVMIILALLGYFQFIYLGSRIQRTERAFVILLMVYPCGILNKRLFSENYAVWLYALNMAMVGIDTALWFRNKPDGKTECKIVNYEEIAIEA